MSDDDGIVVQLSQMEDAIDGNSHHQGIDPSPQETNWTTSELN